MGEYNLPPAQKLMYDLGYVRRQSLWMDVNLMLIAVRNTFNGPWGQNVAVARQTDRIEELSRLHGLSNPVVRR
jgi:hypothetical protein